MLISLIIHKYNTESLLRGHRLKGFTYIYPVKNNHLKYLAFLSLVGVFLLSSCAEKETSFVDPVVNAKEFCQCATKAATLILKMKSTERMDTVLYNSVNESIDEMEKCMSDIPNVEEKAAFIDKLSIEEKKTYETKYYSALDKNCPDVSKAFNSLQENHVH